MSSSIQTKLSTSSFVHALSSRPRVCLRASTPPLAELAGDRLPPAHVVVRAEEDDAPKVLSRRFPLITRISAAVEHQAAVQKFETLAGRSAMLGFSVAIFVEAIAGTPVVGGVAGPNTQLVLALGLTVITAAVVLASRRKLALGGLLLEAVVASLTSTSRSASSLTGVAEDGGLDDSVDLVLEQAFNSSMTSFLERSLADAEASDKQLS